MKISYDDALRARWPKLISIDGRKFKIDRDAIEIWKLDPEAILNAVWNSEKREYRLFKDG